MMEKTLTRELVGLGARLREIRLLRGRTQEKVAELLRLNYRHLQRIEGGKADFKLSTLIRLASFFKIEPCFLANGQTSALFRSVALPCQALMFDALPIGLTLLCEDGKPVFRNRRAQELMDLRGNGFTEELLSAVADLPVGAPPLRWSIELAGGAKAVVEARRVRSPAGRSVPPPAGRSVPPPAGRSQVLFLLDAPEIPFQPRPIHLRAKAAYGTLALPAENVRRYRRARGLTQTEAAATMDMSLRYYQKVESGRLDLKCSTLGKVARTYGVSPCQLLVEDGLRPPCGGNYPCTAGVLDGLPYGIVALGPGGEIAYANEAYYEMIERAPDPETQVHYWDILELETDKENAKNMLEHVFTEKVCAAFERDHTDRNGETRKLVSQWSCLVADQGKALGCVALIRPEELT